MTRLARADVAVIGGGPAGMASALALAQAGARVLLCDAGAWRGRARIGETVPPDMHALLDRLGAWSAFLHGPHLPSAGLCSAWGSPELAFRDSVAHPLGAGWRLDRVHFEAMLLDAAERHGVHVLRRRVLAVDAGASGDWHLSLAEGERGTREATAAFVIDASGRAAAIARRRGARRLICDRLVAVYAVCTLPRDAPENLYSLVEAVEMGWWYAARVSGGRAVIALFTDGDLVAQQSLARPSAWFERLRATRHVRDFLGELACPRRLGTLPATSHCLDRVVGDRWLAVGDAAATWDPLSSAGIARALRSGISGADALIHHQSDGGTALSLYERQTHQQFTRYLFKRQAYYGLELRWPHTAFWQRRQSWLDRSAAGGFR